MTGSQEARKLLDCSLSQYGQLDGSLMAAAAMRPQTGWRSAVRRGKRLQNFAVPGCLRRMTRTAQYLQLLL